MNLGGLWDNWDCFQISYIYVQLFPMRMSELMLTILYFTFIFEAYCVFILIYIYTVCSCFFFLALWGNHRQAGRSIHLWNCVPTKCACFLIPVTQSWL